MYVQLILLQYCNPPLIVITQNCDIYWLPVQLHDVWLYEKLYIQQCCCQHVEHRVYHSYMVMIFIVQSINMSSQGKKITIGHKVSCTTIIILFHWCMRITHGTDVDSTTSIL